MTDSPNEPEARCLNVKVVGILGMLRRWIALREVFRGEWRGGQAQRDPKARVVLFKPFLPAALRDVLAASGTGRDRVHVATPDAVLDALWEGGKDDFDLFTHEVWWHGLRDESDRDGVTGIGSNDMMLRHRTTRNEERLLAKADIVAAFDLVVVHGL